MDMQHFLHQARTARREGRHQDARQVIAEGVRRGGCEPLHVEAAARLLASLPGEDGAAIEVVLLGQCTTSWITAALPVLGLGDGLNVRATEGQYDNVLQELMSMQAAGRRPRVVVLLPWNQRLLGARNQAAQVRIDDEVAFWRQCWEICQRMGSTILQVGLDWNRAGEFGFQLSTRSGDIALLREVNRHLQQSLPSGHAFVDLESISGLLGRQRFYDSRRYFWTKQPFSEEGAVALGRHLLAAIRSILHGPKKVLVLDLDNTCWGGVVGETGPLGVDLGESPSGEAFRAFQAYAKRLSARGVLLAVASKNNPDDAREPFTTNPAMVLSLDDIAAFEASWDPKEMALRRIAKTLNLGLDSFVFFDDNPAEREHIRQALPEVVVPEVPEDPAEYVDALERGLWFEAIGLTDEDLVRTEQYRQERQRRDLETSSGSMEEYLQSLEMIADVRTIGEEDMARVVQLLGKTNQFNLTTRRHSESVVRSMIAQEGTVAFTLRLRDRFGDHGLVAVVIGVRSEHDPLALRLDTWLMSCRVIGRTAEEFTLEEILRQAGSRGYRTILGEYVPTKKNLLVANLFQKLGFEAESTDASTGATRHRLHADLAATTRTFIRHPEDSRLRAQSA